MTRYRTFACWVMVRRLKMGMWNPIHMMRTAFINVLSGQQVVHSFTIENTGNDLLTFQGDLTIVITGTDSGDFTIINQPPTSLEAGQSTTFEVQFQPNSLGARVTTASIDSNDGVEDPFEFAVRGQVDLVEESYWTSQGPAAISEGLVHNLQPNNPVTGAIQTVVAHPTNPNILYLGAVNGGIWKTTNATSLTGPMAASNRPCSPRFRLGRWPLILSDPTSNTLVAGIGRFSNFGGLWGRADRGILRDHQRWRTPGPILVARVLRALISRELLSSGDQVVVASNLAGVFIKVPTAARFLIVVIPSQLPWPGVLPRLSKFWAMRFSDLVHNRLPTNGSCMRLPPGTTGGFFESGRLRCNLDQNFRSRRW